MARSDEDGAGADSAGVGDIGELRFLEVPVEPERLSELRHALARWAARVGLSEDDVAAIELASYEALVNVVEHAYDQDAGGTVDLRARLHPPNAQLMVTVEDRGRWRPLPSEEADPSRGHGLTLIRRLADHAEVISGPSGTTVIMTWY